MAVFTEQGVCLSCGNLKENHERDVAWEEWDCPKPKLGTPDDVQKLAYDIVHELGLTATTMLKGSFGRRLAPDSSMTVTPDPLRHYERLEKVHRESIERLVVHWLKEHGKLP